MLLAALVGLALDPCALAVEQGMEFTECVAVDSPVLEFGEVTMKNFQFSIGENENLSEGAAGEVNFELGPEPSEGFYKMGVFPACIEGGELHVAGVGVALAMPSYFSQKVSDDPTLLWYSSNPCYSPADRVAVAVGGYSDKEVVQGSYVEGFKNGVNKQTWVGPDSHPGYAHFDSFTVTVNVSASDAPAYGDTSGDGPVITLSVAGEAHNGDNRNVSVTFHSFYANGETGSTSNCFVPMDGTTVECQLPGVASGSASASRGGFGGFQIYSSATQPCGLFSSCTDQVVWYAVDSPERDGEMGDISLGYTGQAVILDDGVLDELVYNPMAADLDLAPGQCADFACIESYCEADGAIILELLPWLKCLFRMDVSWEDYADTMRHNIGAIEPATVVRYMMNLVLAFPAAAAGHNGACGPLADLSGTAMEGLTLDTCSLPHQSQVRLILGVLVGLGFATSIIGMLHSWMTTGKIRPVQSTDEADK